MASRPSRVNPKIATILSYGCLTLILAFWAVIAGYLIYGMVTRPHEGLSGLAAIGMLYAIALPCMAAWYGLVWLMRSEIKWVKQSMELVIAGCYLVLVCAGLYFSATGLRYLYRREPAVFIIVVTSLVLVLFYHGSRLKKH